MQLQCLLAAVQYCQDFASFATVVCIFTVETSNAEMDSVCKRYYQQSVSSVSAEAVKVPLPLWPFISSIERR